MNDADILAARPPKQPLDPWRPYAYLVELERTASGRVEDVATVFLTNQECPFRCTMCDLWKYTLDERVPVGAIPAQIDHALEQLSSAKHLKLYNAGNFFDAQAIPPEDHDASDVLVRLPCERTDDALRFMPPPEFVELLNSLDPPPESD